MNPIAQTPEAPYYAVIFSSIRTAGDHGYGHMADRMMALAAEQEGFLGVEMARDAQLGITVSYWRSLDAIAAWKQNVEHLVAQQRGRRDWYAAYSVRISRVEKAYDFQPSSREQHRP